MQNYPAFGSRWKTLWHLSNDSGFSQLDIEIGNAVSACDSTSLPPFATSKSICHDFRKKSIYQLMKKSLNCSINPAGFEDFSSKYETIYFVQTENDVYEFPLRHPKLASIEIAFDIPMYWYNPDTKELGLSIMPGGFFIHYSNNTEWHFSMFLQVMLFTDHLEYRNTERAYERRFLYFAPAARLNRELFRNFIKKVEEAYPSLEIEFHLDKFSIEPEPDKYGFPDKAESSRFYDED